MSAMQGGTSGILPELDRMVEETAYHILRHGDIMTRDGYEEYGHRLCQTYPAINFPGIEPWVSVLLLHCFIYIVFSFNIKTLIRINKEIDLHIKMHSIQFLPCDGI